MCFTFCNIKLNQYKVDDFFILACITFLKMWKIVDIIDEMLSQNQILENPRTKCPVHLEKYPK
jgi:hypothetical protein